MPLLRDRLIHSTRLIVKQRFEVAELFGFESRNKYEIRDESQMVVGFAAEQGKGLWAVIARMWRGHWRRFDIHFFDQNRALELVVRHPFRWFFQRVEVYDPQGRFMGALQQRWAFLAKRFDVQDAGGATQMEMKSPFLKFWTFPFSADGRERAVVRKKWAGVQLTRHCSFKSFDDSGMCTYHL